MWHLEVEVDNVVVMEVLDSSTDLPHEQAAVGLSQVEILSGDPLKELPTVQVLHDEDNFICALESFNEPDNVGVGKLLE